MALVELLPERVQEQVRDGAIAAQAAIGIWVNSRKNVTSNANPDRTVWLTPAACIVRL
jgi:hypothetical protein